MFKRSFGARNKGCELETGSRPGHRTGIKVGNESMILVVHGRFEMFSKTLYPLKHKDFVSFTGEHDTKYVPAHSAETNGIVKKADYTVGNLQQKAVAYINTQTGRDIRKAHHINKHDSEILMALCKFIYLVNKCIAIGNR